MKGTCGSDASIESCGIFGSTLTRAGARRGSTDLSVHLTPKRNPCTPYGMHGHQGENFAAYLNSTNLRFVALHVNASTLTSHW